MFYFIQGGCEILFFQTLWKWLEQGGQTLNAAGNGHNVSGNGGSTIAGVVGLNEANLHAIDAKNTATTWRKKTLHISDTWILH